MARAAPPILPGWVVFTKTIRILAKLELVIDGSHGKPFAHRGDAGKGAVKKAPSVTNCRPDGSPHTLSRSGVRSATIASTINVSVANPIESKKLTLGHETIFALLPCHFNDTKPTRKML